MIAESNFNLLAHAECVATMSDDELLEEGKKLRKVVYPKRISGTGPSSFELRLEICRKEWVQIQFRYKITMLIASSRPSEVVGVPAEKKFGVECKNPECHDWIVLGMYNLATPESRSNLLKYIRGGPWKLTCPACGDTHYYYQQFRLLALAVSQGCEAANLSSAIRTVSGHRNKSGMLDCFRLARQHGTITAAVTP